MRDPSPSTKQIFAEKSEADSETRYDNAQAGPIFYLKILLYQDFYELIGQVIRLFLKKV